MKMDELLTTNLCHLCRVDLLESGGLLFFSSFSNSNFGISSLSSRSEMKLKTIQSTLIHCDDEVS